MYTMKEECPSSLCIWKGSLPLGWLVDHKGGTVKEPRSEVYLEKGTVLQSNLFILGVAIDDLLFTRTYKHVIVATPGLS